MGPLELFGIGDGTFMPRAVEVAEAVILTAAGAPLAGWVGRFLLGVSAGGTGLKGLLPVLRIDVEPWVGRGPCIWDVAGWCPDGLAVVGRLLEIEAGAGETHVWPMPGLAG